MKNGARSSTRRVLSEKLTLKDILNFIVENPQIEIPTSVKRIIERNHQYLLKKVKTELIYGVNTGFGPMAYTYIHPRRQNELQYNLIRSHAVGQGNEVDSRYVRVIMFLRLYTLSRGRSGVSFEVLRGLRDFLNHDITPVVNEHGSVGASGDLVQLAQVALGLIGEGEVYYGGRKMKASVAIKKAGVKKVVLAGRDGLALINGTAAMTAYGAVAILKADTLLRHALTTSATLFEVSNADSGVLSEEIHDARPHVGQRYVAQQIMGILRGRKQTESKLSSVVKLKSEDGTDIQNLNFILQDIYSIRCVPQILGPIFDTINSARSIIETELQSITDNPLILSNRGVFHGGNFHGDYVALEMDKVKLAITKLSMLFERQINFLCDPVLNKIFPPFLNRAKVGVNLSIQGLQFVATSTVAENQTLSTSHYIHSIPTNNGNQDIVSMGSNAALSALKVIDNTYEIMSILVVALIQAAALRSDSGHVPCRAVKDFLDQCMNFFPPIAEDRGLQTDFKALLGYLSTLGTIHNQL